MRARLPQDRGGKTWAPVFDIGDEVIGGLTAFGRENGLDSSHFTAIGAFERTTLAYFDRVSKEYQELPIEEQVEVLSLVGDIALKGTEPQVHAHVVVGRSDGTTRGGHLLAAHVWPTLEVVLTETPEHLRRRHDEESGLALIAID